MKKPMLVLKRNGEEVTFDRQKIFNAISAANKEVAPIHQLNKYQIEAVTKNVTEKIEEMSHIVSVEEIQDMVEVAIMEMRGYEVAQKYVRYRHKRELARKSNTTDEGILALINLSNEEIKQENSNKNPTVNSTQRDYMAGEVSKDLTMRVLLPEDIVVVASDEVEADWHPRHCDTEKTYEYKILNSKFPDPMRRRDTYHVSFDLDLEKMREAAGYLKGEHDFKSFCNVHTQVEDTVRTIYDLEVEKEEELITIRVRGNGFLYNMVRILAGTLIGVGRGAIAPEQIPAILEAKDRQAAGMTVPPQGLTLVKIDYLDEKSK